MRVRAGSGAWRVLALLIGVPWVAPEPMWGDLPTVDYDHFGQQGRDAYLAIEAAPGERRSVGEEAVPGPQPSQEKLQVRIP